MGGGTADGLLFLTLMAFLGSAIWRYGLGIYYESRLLNMRRQAESLQRATMTLVAEARDLRSANDKHQTKIDRMRKDLSRVRMRLAELSKGRYAVIHTAGRPASDRRCFSYELSSCPPSIEEFRPAFDPRFWVHKNIAQVWAEDADVANRMASIHFDPRHGYRRSNLIGEMSVGN